MGVPPTPESIFWAVTWSGAEEQAEFDPEKLGNACSSCLTTSHAPALSVAADELEEVYRAPTRAAFCTPIAATEQKPASATLMNKKKIKGASIANSINAWPRLRGWCGSFSRTTLNLSIGIII